MTDRKTIIAVTVFAIVTIIFFWDVFLYGNAAISTNIVYRYEPWFSMINGTRPQAVYFDPAFEFLSFLKFDQMMYRQGEMPLWNPYLFSGYPHMANSISAVFNPPQILLLILSPVTVHTITVIIQFFLVGVFTYLFLREIRVNQYGSIVGALVFMLCGFNTTWIEWRTFIGAGLWLPLILLYLNRQFRTGNVKYSIYAGFCLTLSIFAGMIQITAYLLIVVALYVTYRLYHLYEAKDRDAVTSQVKKTGVFLVIGLCLAAVQLIPLAEYSLYSQRISWNFDELSFIPFENLVEFIMPEFYSGPNNSHTNLNRTRGGFISPLETRFYVGILPLFLILIGVISSKNTEKNFFAYLMIASLTLVLGTKIYLIFYYAFPMFAKLGPARLIYLINFSASILAGMGAHTVHDTLAKGRKMPESLTKTLRLSYIVVGLLLFENFLMLLASVITLELIIRKKSLRTVGALIIIVIIADLVPNGLIYNPRGQPSELFPQTESINFLSSRLAGTNQRIMQGGSYAISPLNVNSNVFFKIESATGYDSMYPLRYRRLLDDEYEDTRDMGWVSVNRVEFSDIESGLTDLLNVRYVLSEEPILMEKLFTSTWNNIIDGQSIRFGLAYETPVKSIQIISFLTGYRSDEIKQGTIVGTVTLTDENGKSKNFNLTVGVDTASRYIDNPNRAKDIRHVKPEVYESDKADATADKRIWYMHSYKTEYILDEPFMPTSLTVEYNHAQTQIQLRKILFGFQTDRFTKIWDKDMLIYENANAMPRAFIQGRVNVIKNESMLVSHLQSPIFDPRAEVVLEEDVNFENTSVNGTAGITHYSPNRVDIIADLDDDGILVLADQNYPGWNAYADGEQVKVYTAYYILRAIKLGKGQHNVTFIYEPLSYRIGLAITLITLFLTAYYLVYQRKRKSWSRPMR